MKNLIIGLLGGISLGLLFAPEKGKTLRDKLAQSDSKIKDFGEALISVGKDASDEVKLFLNSDDVASVLAKGQTSADELLVKGKQLSNKGQEEVKALFEKASTEIKKRFS